MRFTEKRICKALRREILLSIEVHLEKAIEKGVISALKSFGADVDNQQEVQCDFHFLRKLRKRSEESSHMLIRAVISVTIGTAAVTLWEGVKIILLK
ncbi:hypothetical protein [Candidatus Tisiphia endosymbiont of Ptychoptera albimana]|uniref:hypothetical protein n=1 Tax=Candidatus Tisiphia endosymbiont of Ptychoptera albimana TaxID=3066260 RepID=UPI00312C9822